VRYLKIFEEVFNQTYNSGRFVHALSYLLTVFAGDAFDFYNKLAIWWDRQGLAGKSHSPEGVLALLVKFAESLSPEQQSRVKELLKFDAALDVSGALKGELLDWNRERWARPKSDCWRNEAAVRRYIPDYRFTNWRDVKRKYPIEIFSQNVPRWIATGEWSNQDRTPVLFDVGRKRPVWFALTQDELPMEDEN